MSEPDSTGKERLQELIGPDYRLQWIIGHGGMSTVWLADDTVNDREVAVKVLRPEFSDNSEFLSRFRNEAEAAEAIHSDHVVATYDYREVPAPAGHTFCFIVMEYIRGESLADMLEREGKLPEDLALDVMEQAAHGLSVIHRMGLVHRDIKPGNILVTANGIVKITDFGIAKAAAAVPLTRTGMVVGTAQYVSPEQAQGHTVTPSSDVYSLGVVGYEMMAGHRPFTGDSSVSVAIAHINEAPPQMPTSITAQTRELIGIALRKDPTRRFADGNELTLAVSAVRLGQRPPQPRTAAVQKVAVPPSPSASTAMLGKVARPVTVVPVQEPRGSGIGIGLFIAVLLAVIIGAVIYAGATGLIFGNSEETTTPATVTHTFTPTETTEEIWEPTTSPARPTTQVPAPTDETSSEESTTSQEATTRSTRTTDTTDSDSTTAQTPTEPTVPSAPTTVPTEAGTPATTALPEETLAPVDELLISLDELINAGGNP
ncbi:serine/threonine-protein kinase [uncultured Corynebacterium sp.]|uniref:serine/threonine-protein kinase n=1 Tax=uncultured Corynebacterium sp. TaxID=159447 RepID=UPI0025FABF16|nr:serine/threonine-protein kinase [uncultured Corynebacterium sp.]